MNLLQDLKIFDNVTIVNHGVNLGKSEAIRTGFNLFFTRSSDLLSNEINTTEFVGYLDSDLAFSLAEIDRFKNIAVQDSLGLFENGIDSIWSARVQLKGHLIERKIYRHYIGRLIATLLSLADSSMPYDSQSGFKIFVYNQSLIQVFKSEFKTKWYVDLEISSRYALTAGKKLQIWEEPLRYWKDISGSSLTWRSIPGVIFETIFIFRQLLKSSKL